MTPNRTPTLRLKVDAVQGAMSARGISGNEQLSRTLGISLATVKRVMKGDQPPSSTFVAALRIRLGLDFNIAVEAVEIPAGEYTLARTA